MQGIHPDLRRLADKALELSSIDFGVSEGLRSMERQRHLVDIGASHTLSSRHLTGHAIDVFPWVDGDVRWDWPLFYEIREGFVRANMATDIPFVWGGSWSSFPDGPHFELSRRIYRA